jgi:hypothetical protein
MGRKVAAKLENKHPKRNPISQFKSYKLNDMIIAYWQIKHATERLERKKFK